MACSVVVVVVEIREREKEKKSITAQHDLISFCSYCVLREHNNEIREVK